MTRMPRAGILKCPTCKQAGDWLAGKYGVFCSHRCKLVDLGKWLDGGHVISEPLRPGQLERYADLPAGEYLDRGESD